MPSSSYFQKHNVHVFATARDLSHLTHLETLPNVTLLTLDPASMTSITTAREIVKTTTGGTLDYLLDNAEQTIIMPTLDSKLEAEESTYNKQVGEIIAVNKAFAPLVIAAKGQIISIASISHPASPPCMGKNFSDTKEKRTILMRNLRN